MKKAPPWTNSLAATNTKPRLWWVACTIFGGQPQYKLCWARALLQIGWALARVQTVLSSLTNWLMTNIRGWPLLSTLALTLACWPGRHSLCRRKSLRDRLLAHFATRTSPFSVSPHEKIHGNLKTKPCFSTTVIIEESKEPKLSFRPSLLNCFPMEYKFAGHFSKKIEKHQFIRSSFT